MRACYDAQDYANLGSWSALAAMNRLDFEGGVAVVTGGATGIGLATARRLVASGGRASLWDRDEAALRRAAASLGADTAVEIVDVADAADVSRAAQSTSAKLGRIDALVCSAGITGPNTTTWEYPVDEWRRVIDVNLNGVFHCNRAVVPLMLARDYGRIVNIASVAGKEGNPNASAYSASKAAVIGLTKSLGKELARTGIRVNCVTPAAVKTAIFDQMTQQHIDFMLSKIPLGRFGTVDEIAALVAWLCTAECSFSTGAVFDLSGGRATF
jgi:3-oxoacyl-[acyl-carrier protein] reductase